jgi:hypothetical protein
MHDWGLILVARHFGYIFYLDDALVKYRQHGNNQVGARRLRSVFRAGLLNGMKRARNNVYMLSVQARRYHAAYGIENLKPQDASTLLALRDFCTMNVWSRLRLVFAGTLRKNTFMRNVLLIIVLCFPTTQKE